jgi:cytochrome b pre-mRNA-processing protein 3
MADGIFKRWFNRSDECAAARPLYAAIVAEARQPAWYVEGGVPDTIDGRFEMVSGITALVMARLDVIGLAAAEVTVRLADVYAEDMEGQLREIGIGDAVVGKHMGKMVGALGGRFAAYRDALIGEGDLGDALLRNLYRNAPPSADALAFVTAQLKALHAQLQARTLAQLLLGAL